MIKLHSCSEDATELAEVRRRITLRYKMKAFCAVAFLAAASVANAFGENRSWSFLHSTWAFFVGGSRAKEQLCFT